MPGIVTLVCVINFLLFCFVSFRFASLRFAEYRKPKIWPWLEILAKNTRVFACSCVRKIFASARMLGFSLKCARLGPVRTTMTKFVWLNQKSQQKLSPPNFQFGNRDPHLRNFFFRSCRVNCKICIVFTLDKIHLCPGLHANAKIAIFAKNRKNRKWCKEEDKSPTRTRDFCDFSQKSLKSQKSRLFSGTCVLYHFSVVRCLRF